MSVSKRQKIIRVVRVRRRRGQRRRGSAIVEFAVVAPILFALFAFLWEFSRMEMLQHSAATASYEGARQGIVHGASAEDARDAAEAILNAVGVNGYTVRITPATIDENTVAVQVDVNIPIARNAFITPFFMKGMEVDSTFSLRRDGVD